MKLQEHKDKLQFEINKLSNILENQGADKKEATNKASDIILNRNKDQILNNLLNK